MHIYICDDTYIIQLHCNIVIYFEYTETIILV